MPLNTEDRAAIEESIMDSQIACERFLKDPRLVTYNLLEGAVTRTLLLMEGYKAELQQDHKKDNYKLHMLVPLQTFYMQNALAEASVKRKPKGPTTDE